MLEIHIPEQEYFDREASKIRRSHEVYLQLEHSLLTISKWETIWEVPFLSDSPKTTPQLYGYIEIMVGENVEDTILQRLTNDHYQQIRDFLNGKHSATWFNDKGKKPRHTQATTSELIYYWMTVYNIPFECERWPLARLMNLIKIASIKNDPEPKKSNKSDMLSERAALNAKRRADTGTKG